MDLRLDFLCLLTSQDRNEMNAKIDITVATFNDDLLHLPRKFKIRLSSFLFLWIQIKIFV